jgi:hypothetical protein
MSVAQPSAADSLLAEGTCDLVSERRVLGLEAVDLDPGGIEAST